MTGQNQGLTGDVVQAGDRLLAKKKGSDEEDARHRLEVGARLKSAALALGFTSETLAGPMKVSSTTIRGWWAGRSTPSGAKLKRYSELVRVPPEVLAFGSAGAESLLTVLQQFIRQAAAGEAGDEILYDLFPHAEVEPELVRALKRISPGLLQTLNQRAGKDWQSLPKAQQLRIVRATAIEMLSIAEGQAEVVAPSPEDTTP